MTQLMYIGPSRPYGAALMANAIIFDIKGVAGLQKIIDEHPIIENLFVKIKDLGEARILVKEKGSSLNNAYTTVKAESNKMRDGGK